MKSNTENNVKTIQLTATNEDLNDTGSSLKKPEDITTYQITDQTFSVSNRKRLTIFLACAVVYFTSIIDQNTLAVALPKIGAALGANSEVSWVAVAYFTTVTSFQLLCGRLSDIWSRKFILISGLTIFFLGTLAASFATSIIQLIIFRAFAGIGGGSLVTVSQIIIGDVVSLRERGKWQGILGAIVAISNGVGPLMGGVISSKSKNSWRWIFRLNLFNALFATLMVVFYMPLKKVDGHWKTKLKAVDFFGAALTIIGFVSMNLGLTWGGVIFPWKSYQVISSLIFGGLCLISFLLWQWKGARLPLIPQSRTVQGATLSTYITGWNFFFFVYFVPTFYQLAYGYTPVRAAVMLMPYVIFQALSSTLGGLVVSWQGRYRESIIFGFASGSIGLGLHSSLTPKSSLVQQVAYSILTGIGAGLTFQPSLIAMQAGVKKEHMAVVTGVRGFIRNFGGTSGLAVTGSIIYASNTSLHRILSSSVKSSHISLTPEQIDKIMRNPSKINSMANTFKIEHADKIKSLVLSAYFSSFRRVFYLSTSLAFLGLLTAVFLLPNRGLGLRESRRITEEEKSCDEKA